MAAIQIGKYKRPGIFFEEFDQSIIPNPPVPGVNIPPTLVIGVSKKGPVNTPILISNLTDLEQVFGPLDRTLERKGSFFHRTVAKMLESNTVLAMNLLATDDTLDKVEYRSLSTSSDKSNDIIREIPFRKVHDTSSFWKKDTTTFIDTVKDEPSGSDRLFHLTNLSNRYTSVFIFKSRLTGFNQSLLEYYGTADKVPPYTNPLDFASDYLVDVLIVGGDWSNYAELSVDQRWSAFFNGEGLLKNQVSNFAQNRNVNTLGFYEGCSLIPYFKDSDGRNIFIESVINANTERTGIFCAFNSDKLEGDFSNGMVDIIGNNLAKNNELVDVEKDSIDFLSYQETITQQNDFLKVTLDNANGPSGQSVVALGPSLSSFRGSDWYSYGSRTAYFSSEYINGLVRGTFGSITASTDMTVEFVASSPTLGTTTSQPYFVYNGSKTLIGGGVDTATSYTFSIPITTYLGLTAALTQSFYSVFYLNSSTGAVDVTVGKVVDAFPTIATTDVVLGFASYSLSAVNTFHNQTFVGIGIGGTVSGGSAPSFTDYNDFIKGVDYTVTDNGSGSITVTFLGTGQTDVTSNYAAHRRIRLFNFLVSMLDSTNLSKMTMLKDTATKEKLSLENATISNIVTSTTQNKSFTLNLGVSTTPEPIANGNLVFYKQDDEFYFGNSGFETKSTAASATYGVAGKYSSVYTSFFDGNINTGDYFYGNLTDKVLRVVFTNDGVGKPVIVFDQSPWSGITGTESIVVPDSILNYKTFTLGDVATNSIVDPATGASFSGTYNSNYFSYYLDKSVTTEDLSSVTSVWDVSTRYYLSAYSSGAEFTVDFKNAALSATVSVNTTLNKDLTVISDLANLKETIEIYEPAGYTPIDNKVLILGSRYADVKIGDFLLAFVDEDPDVLSTGEVGRRLTRILNKKSWSVDPTYAEVTCDSKIQKITVGTSKQTLRYTQLDSYANTYKAIPLKGFRVREASMPDGTESTQTSIMNVVSSGTTLFKALVNKDAIDFRYVVDSFGLGLIENSKQQIVDICGERLDCLGFANMPSMRQFRSSANPSFLDANGNLDTALIAAGGDAEKNPNFLYSFGKGRGVSSVGYFLPYLIVNDNGRPTELPPAMFAATTYLRKQLALETAVVPWTIAAGVTNGKILGIQGVEQNYSFTDIENLNLAQMNPIVFKRNRGFVIETENTAQVIYKSALSLLHVREVLIELERELGNMLLDFQWKFNTPDTRAEIKLKADVICETYVSRNGLYNYFNKCDEENNPPDLIDRQIGVIDTYVEPIKGMGVIVNNITILRTGAIEAGGFA